MDLVETLRSTGAAREFVDEPVDDEVLHRLLDTARFAPNGGNRQAWRVVVVRDPDDQAGAPRPVPRPAGTQYLAMGAAGLTPWAPVTDRSAEAAALSQAGDMAAAGTASPGFAERLDEVPVLLVLLADLAPPGRRRPRPRPLHARRRRLDLPVRLEPRCWRPGPRASAAC